MLSSACQGGDHGIALLVRVRWAGFVYISDAPGGSSALVTSHWTIERGEDGPDNRAAGSVQGHEWQV